MRTQETPNLKLQKARLIRNLSLIHPILDNKAAALLTLVFPVWCAGDSSH